MLDYIFYIDKVAFIFLNNTISNPVMDLLMPLVTDWSQSLIMRIVLGCVFVYFLFFNGTKGRIIIILLFLTVLISDQVSSSLIKPIVARPRPCHLVEGKFIVENLRLLVSCGPGFSFPSSHAVNHFAVAFILSKIYHKFKIYFFSFAILVSFSRVYIGVHYPLDVFIGAIIGVIIAITIYESYSWLYIKFLKKYTDDF